MGYKHEGMEPEMMVKSSWSCQAVTAIQSYTGKTDDRHIALFPSQIYKAN